jgi:hypothetical protein
MKIAFHFDASHPDVEGYYGRKIGERFFSALLRKRNLHINTKVFVGDVLFRNLGARQSKKGKTTTISFDREKYLAAFSHWCNTGNSGFSDFQAVNPAQFWNSSPYALVLDSIDLATTRYLCGQLKDCPYYLGALEVDEASPVHYALYQLIPLYRIVDRGLRVFWDGISTESKIPNEIRNGKDYGFSPVKYESLNGRYTIFDAQHNFVAARRRTEFRFTAGGFLAFLADSVVNRLDDVVPDFADRLWAVMDTLDRAETPEQYSQAATSCRRIVEVAIDAIEPPKKGDEVFGEGKFKNRVKKFADKSIGATTIDFVGKSGDEFKQQVDRLVNLTSRGVHHDILYADVRRCFIRLLVLLDDVLSLNAREFPIQIKYDATVIDRLAERAMRRQRRT